MILQQLFNNMAIKRSKLTIICTIKITQQIAWIFLYNLESFTNSLEMNHAIFINVTIKENTWLFLVNVSEKIQPANGVNDQFIDDNEEMLYYDK